MKQEFTVGSENLVGQFAGPEKPTVLFIHGAGTSNRQRFLPFAEKLAESGISSFLFDFSGHGESTGQMTNSSLKKRVEEAEAATQFLDTSKPITLVAASMGGHIALELIRNHPEIKNLILFCPAVYSEVAFEILFTEEFSKVIREPESWRNGPWENLKNFEGKVLLMAGERDEVIPIGVIELIQENAKNIETVIIPGASHLLLLDLLSSESLLNEMIEKMVKLMKM